MSIADSTITPRKPPVLHGFHGPGPTGWTMAAIPALVSTEILLSRRRPGKRSLSGAPLPRPARYSRQGRNQTGGFGNPQPDSACRHPPPGHGRYQRSLSSTPPKRESSPAAFGSGRPWCVPSNAAIRHSEPETLPIRPQSGDIVRTRLDVLAGYPRTSG